ncbi:MAG: metal-dependent hydrolase [Nitrospirae bacterium]|nr:MAG: metal-dependent hydrolase [Nitrospirota bacterium]
MATPIGHSLAGYLVYRAGMSSMPSHTHKPMLLACVLVAVGPDFDFLPGLLVGQPALYHQGITHSLGMAIGISGLVAWGVSRRWHVSQALVTLWGICFFAYGSHLLIDLCGVDHRPPYGIPLLWPFSQETYLAPVQIFWGVRHATATSNTTLEWLANLLDLHNLGAIGIEIGVVSPWILALEFVRSRWKKPFPPAVS